MSLYVTFDGRLGNNLFQYFFGYVLSKKINSNFYTLGKVPEFLPDRYTATLPSYDIHIKEVWSNNKIHYNINNNIIDKDLDVIVNEIKKYNPSAALVTGFHQDINFYLPFLQDIVNFFKTSEQYKKIKETVDSNGVGVCIRKDDVANSLNDLPDEWFLKNIEKLKSRPIYITTDQIHHPLCQYIVKHYNAKIIQMPPINKILFFSCFKDLILSQGTFSWWTGILCDGNVYSMLPKTGWNSNDQQINLKTPWWNWLKIEEI